MYHIVQAAARRSGEQLAMGNLHRSVSSDRLVSLRQTENTTCSEMRRTVQTDLT